MTSDPIVRRRTPYDRIRLAAGLLAVLLIPTVARAAGVLIPRGGGDPISIESHRVTATITDGVARTKVRQTFVNRNSRTREAVYLFPLPDGAALVDVAMEVGGQRLEGLLAERQRARKVYDDIVRRNKDPALVEQIGRSKFRLSVFPVLRGKPTVVEITYVEHLPLSRGEFRYVYPLASGGRVTSVGKDLTITATIDSSAPLEEVTSNAPDARVARKGTGRAVVSLERTAAKLDGDLVVTARVVATQPTLAIRTWRPRDGHGYFMAVMTPPPPAKDQLIPRDVVLVLDTSGSMGTEDKIDQAKSAARHLLNGLRPGDRVNLIRFGSTVEAFADVPVAATSENIAGIREFILGLQAAGGTALGEALSTALAMTSCPGRVQTVVLLTDGQPTVGTTRPGEIAAIATAGGKKGIAVYPFGVGSSANASLLRGIARATGGQAEIFRAGGEVVSRLTRFLDRTNAPLVTDVSIAGAGVTLFDLYPRRQRVIHAGEQYVVTGRFRGTGESRVLLSAMVGGKPRLVEARHRFFLAEGGDPAVRDLYARQKLEFLSTELQIRSGLHDEAWFAAVGRGTYGTANELKNAIIDVSLAHRVQSAFTAFLVLLPEDRNRIDPRDAGAIAEALKRSRRVQGLASPPAGRPAPDAESPRSPTWVGDDIDTRSDLPFEGPSTSAAIGIGGGVGGPYGARGGFRNLRVEGGDAETQAAVVEGLIWLAKEQRKDGTWAGPEANTSLTVLAYLGAGDTHRHGHHKRTVKAALRHLKNAQAPDGCFADRSRPGWMKAHALATLAMTEAWGLTGSPLFKGPAQRGIDFLHRAQVPFFGWGTSVRTQPCDPETTFHAICALKSAKACGLRTSQEAFDGVETWIARATDPKTGLMKVPPGARFSTPAATSAAVVARIFCGEKPDGSEWIAQQTGLTLLHLPGWTDTGPADLWQIHFGTMATFQMGGATWESWNATLKRVLLEVRDREKGCWAGNRTHNSVETTAIACIALEIYYRYPRVFRVR